MKIVVTGCAGFVGSTLINAIQNRVDLEILGIDNMSFGYAERMSDFGDNVVFINADIMALDVRDYFVGADAVIHLAAIAPLPDNQIDPGASFSVNVGGTAAVLEHCRMTGVPYVIHMSSGAVYEGSDKFPSRETDPINTRLVYPQSKWFSEHVCASFCAAYNMSVSAIRLFNLYGPKQDFFRKQPPLIGYLLRSFFQGEKAHLFSDGHQKRDYIYIDDLVQMIDLMVGKRPKGYNLYNACSGTVYSVRDILGKLEDLLGAPIDCEFSKASEFWPNYPNLRNAKFPLSTDFIEREVTKHAEGDPRLAQKQLGFDVSTDLQVGLGNCVNYARTLFSP